MRGVDVSSDRMGRSPIEWGIVDGSELASRDEPLIDRSVAAGVERKDVVEDRAVSVAFLS